MMPFCWVNAAQSHANICSPRSGFSQVTNSLNLSLKPSLISFCTEACWNNSQWLKQQTKARVKHAESETLGEPTVNLRLNGIQSGHVHLEQPILPVDSGDSAVMDASRYVTKLFPVFPKAVALVVHAEWTRCPELQANTSEFDSHLDLQILHWSSYVASKVSLCCVSLCG